VPNEEIPFGFETNIRWPLHLYGIKKWTDFFSPRQLLCHATSVKIFRDLVNEELGKPEILAESSRSALAYLTISLNKLLNYNSRMSVWMPTREVVANTFNRHDFAFCWSHAEMATLIVGLGYDWAFGQVAKWIGELIELVA
jgi:putative DNA methylase